MVARGWGGGTQKVEKIRSLPEGWGFKATEESSSPTLELVSLRTDRMLDWNANVLL